MKHRLVVPVILLFGAGCDRHSADAGGSSAPVPAGYVARAGADLIHSDTVARIARDERITARAALERALSDSVFASAARERLGPGFARVAERSAHARVLLEEVSRAAAADGPPTPEEVDQLTALRWWELDRPPMLRTTHAVVTPEKCGDAKASAVASRIHQAVVTTSASGEFKRAAESVASDGCQVRVEDLDPVARDGRALNPSARLPPGTQGSHYDVAFVEAAFAIPRTGAVSEVVKSSFGYHVILSVELVPEHRVPFEERKKLLESEILSRRSARRLEELKKGNVAPREIDPAALDLMEKVKSLP